MEKLQSRLSKLRLHGMAHAWQTLLETRQHLKTSLSDGLDLLLQNEEDDRENRRFKRLEKLAKFRYHSSINSINTSAARGLDNTMLNELACGQYISQGRSVLITGATGCGKSYIATALGYQACMQGYKVLYKNTQKLLAILKIARLEGSITKLFDNLAKTNLLIIDDFGLNHLEQQQALDLMEILEDRHGKNATIIASQLPVENWYEVIGESTVADAIMDRLVHTSHRIALNGKSLRQKM